MKFFRIFGFFCFFIPCVSFAAGSADFQTASKLLSAARRGDIQTVQVLINAGANVNYVDATGLSLVCTAVMNNDTRATQILQMYGADSSNCDRQIKQYKQKTRVAARGEEYGFFSGLSSTQVLALSAVGVVAVLGGIVLLTDAFDSENNNGGAGINGDRPSGGGGGSTATVNALFAQNLPYGPACSGTSCPSDFTFWEGSKDFTYMSDNTTQNVFNYLMVAHAYDAFVRGYLGMSTIRIESDKTPFDLSTLPYTSVPGGGKPVNVAMITGNGINATGSAIDGLITWFDDSNSSTSTIQSICNLNGSSSSQCQAALANATKVSHKYYNYTGATAATGETTAFDLSGGETVFGLASDSDTKLAKIIAGWEEGGRSTGDFYGFIPNGQLTVYKTGNGTAWVDTTSEDTTGSYTKSGASFAENDTMTLTNGTVVTISSVSGNTFVATDASENTYNGYIVGDDVYIDSNHDGNINQMYVVGGENTLTLTKETAVADYKNYAAILSALQLQDSGNYVASVVANLSLVPNSSSLGYATVSDAKVFASQSTELAAFSSLVNNYYKNTPISATVSTPAMDANTAFTVLGNYQKQILVNPAGRSVLGLGTNKSLSAQDATFENYAPLVYDNLQNLFATVVAVRPADGTKGTSISGYSASGAGKLGLSTWADANDSNTIYSSRMCGLTGTGNGGAMNPWCFAAPGVTDLDATAAMAGSVALVKSAFSYMSPKEIFLLLALTADGPYLGTNPETNLAWTSTDALISYLQNMYTLPGNLDSSSAQYLESFKNAFGYGMINLERATRPGTNIYYYGSDKNTIVSASGNSYWRNAATTTTSARASTVLSLTNRQAIKTSFFDVIESADGSVSLPRVWNMTFASEDSKRGLYMGDVLADFDVGTTNKRTSKIGKFSFDMSLSPRAYNDNLNGLDDLHIAFNSEKYSVDAGYQRHLTDGESMFNGRANGVLALASNAVTSGARYKFGNASFGARAFSGTITDENLLEMDPVVSAQFEPGRLGLASGGVVDIDYNTDRFGLNLSVGNMRETNTVLGMYSDGLLALNGGDTEYVDAVAMYKPNENMKLSVRATFANTHADIDGGVISRLSDIKSNAFSVGLDTGKFNFTVALPLAVVGGHMGYDYADFDVVENNGEYEIAMNNPHIEYVDLSTEKREMRFSGSYKRPFGEFTDAGIGFIYRVNPNNTDVFGNESILMLKIRHRSGI